MGSVQHLREGGRHHGINCDVSPNRFFTQLSVTALSLGACCVTSLQRQGRKHHRDFVLRVRHFGHDFNNFLNFILQIMFVLCLFLTLAAVAYFAVKAARGRIHDIRQQQLLHRRVSGESSLSTYSPLEKKLLFPILLMVQLASKILVAFFKIRDQKHSQTVVCRKREMISRRDSRQAISNR